MNVLTQAFSQWCNRPADQRFSSIAAMKAAVIRHYETAVEQVRSLRGLSVQVANEAPVLQSEKGQAHFTHYSFGQFARQVGAPAQYLRTLPAELVKLNLNNGLANLVATDLDASHNLLLGNESDRVEVRALTTDSYKRIWNRDIVAKVERLTQEQPEWQPAPEAFDGSRGLYASEHDMFMFMVDNDRRIFQQDKNGGLGRGFFVSNSEVGAASFSITTFMYEYVCGNHRVWGAKGVQELRIRHVGNADARAFSQLAVELRKYADSSATGDEEKVKLARAKLLGVTADEVLDAVFQFAPTRGQISRKLIQSAFDKATERTDWYGDPRSVWGFTGGLTEIARDLPNADERVKLDRVAGKLMQIAF